MTNRIDIEKNNFKKDQNEEEGIYSEIPKKYSMKSEFRKQFKENLLLAFTILSVIIGVIIGFILRKYTTLTPVQKQYSVFMGEIFLRMLKFLILPLISSSLICGIASLGSANKAANVASKALFYYMSTTFLAVLLGLFLVITIKPGVNNKSKIMNSINQDFLSDRKISPFDTILDLIRNLFPDNLIQMSFVQYESKILPKYKSPLINSSNNFNSTKELDYWYPVPSQRQGINVLGLVMFCLVFGFTISKMEKYGQLLLELFEAINEASIKIISYVMLFSPIGICSLICGSILNMDDPKIVFEKISLYVLTVLLGLIIHGCIILPGIYLIVTKRNIFFFAKNMIEAFLIAIATSSSNATLPVTFKCIEFKNKIPKSISRFVLPVGATINMDGTALYEAIAAIFIAQINNLHLTFVDYMVTSFTATLASIGAAGVPSAGLVTMVIVLSALNLPQTQISLIYAVDWFLDRFRTLVNVWGDSIGAGIVSHLCEEDSQEIKNLEEREDSFSRNLSLIERKRLEKELEESRISRITHVNEGFRLEEHHVNETSL
ncbi:unnamed protein product [Brachionus calyciflorus]|uniref:Amino acid transporter n=1 Tax=Brachionus calyciflorus TaxID=104777 RepID=A0A814AKV5_9BILA|nr:unnamed protein product [Brachionus calyciflorus]